MDEKDRQIEELKELLLRAEEGLRYPSKAAEVLRLIQYYREGGWKWGTTRPGPGTWQPPRQ